VHRCPPDSFWSDRGSRRQCRQLAWRRHVGAALILDTLTSGGTWSPSFTTRLLVPIGYSLDAYLWPVPETEPRFLGCPTCTNWATPGEIVCIAVTMCVTVRWDFLVWQRPITIYCQVVWSTFASVALTDLHVSSHHSALKCPLPDRGILPAAVTFDWMWNRKWCGRLLRDSFCESSWLKRTVLTLSVWKGKHNPFFPSGENTQPFRRHEPVSLQLSLFATCAVYSNSRQL